MRGIDDALEHIVFLAKHFKDVDEGFILKALLIEIGIPTGLEGFGCIREAVLLRVDNPEAPLFKEIYPTLAKSRGIYCRPKHVEGVIRCAIRNAWNHRDEIWYSYFPDRKRPSNGEFISRMAAMIEMWRECAEMERRRSDEQSE